jgi:hypothetical protein
MTKLERPYVDPGVTDPEVLRYAAHAADRYRAPVAGGPPIAVPRLDTEAVPGLTMADQAALARGAGALPETPPPPALLPHDLLPDIARSDPEYREGAGSRYASAQPELARRYGVLRGGRHVPPAELDQPRPGLRPETLAGLRSLAISQEDARAREAAQGDEARAAAERGPAAAAARVGEPPAPARATAGVQAAVEKLDDFDLHTLKSMMMKDLLNNDEQRNVIEARLEPLSLDDLLVRGFVTQVVPIVPGKFEPELQSMSADEDLELKRLIVEQTKSLDVGDRYVLDLFSLMTVAAGLRAVNKKPLPDHRDADGKFDKEAFFRKFALVRRMNLHMLASIGINYFWFDVRVRRLFVAEALGNG